MESITKWLQDISGLSSYAQIRVFISVVLIVGLWLIRMLAVKVVWNKTEDPVLRYRWRKTIGYTYFILVVLVLLRVWFEATQSIVTVLGFFAAGLAIALQDLIKSVAGWLFLIWRRPFVAGDRIEIGKFKGDVIDIRPFKFSLVEVGNWVDADQSTGRVMHLPNSMILSETIINFNEGFQYIWDEIPVLVTFESNWKKAKEILKAVASRHAEVFTEDAEKKIREASKKFWIFYNKLTPIVYTSVRECGVQLTIRYLAEPRRRRTCEQEIWEDILMEFSKADDIDFAYPTQRFYDNIQEGKEGCRSPGRE